MLEMEENVNRSEAPKTLDGEERSSLSLVLGFRRVRNADREKRQMCKADMYV